MPTLIDVELAPLLGQRSSVGNYTGRLPGCDAKYKPKWEFLPCCYKPSDALEPELARAVPIFGLSGRRRLLAAFGLCWI
jgi:hypothetical protein